MYQMKVVMLDYDGGGMKWMDEHAENVALEEMVTLRSASSDNEVPLILLNDLEGWDYLLVFFPEELREKVSHVIATCKIPDEKVIWPAFLDSLLTHRAAAYYMFNEFVRKHIEYYTTMATRDYFSVTTREHLSFIGSSKDQIIIPTMFMTQDCWAKDEMTIFYKLAHQYYSFQQSQVYFCDIGANIGTTSIFFKKMLDPAIRIIAFEPVYQNYRSLRCNLLLNDIDENDCLLVQKGVSDHDAIVSVLYDEYNPGASFLKETGDSGLDTQEVVAFDSFIREHKIEPEKIKYIWVDVEGYEGAFTTGAEKTLKEINVPVVMEFTPLWIKENGGLDCFVTRLKSIYSNYISLSEPSHIHDIEELYQYENNTHFSNGNILQLDIFLLKHVSMRQ